jgi:peptidoglycan biosynthesis protein MviN/MurJ (putative lipid II flippase)
MNWREIGMTLLKTTMATMVMSITCLVLMGWATNSSDLSGRGLRLALPLVGGIGSFFATAALIGLHEPMMLLRIRHSSKTEESRSTDGEA